MIKSKDLNQEVRNLDEKYKLGTAGIPELVKAVCLLVKVVRDVRTNQTLIMRAQGIKLIEGEEAPKKAE